MDKLTPEMVNRLFWVVGKMWLNEERWSMWCPSFMPLLWSDICENNNVISYEERKIHACLNRCNKNDWEFQSNGRCRGENCCYQTTTAPATNNACVLHPNSYAWLDNYWAIDV